jgi:uncharacterized membrane protein
MILFSDAVFAIAITLLIIEIKFPEISKGASTHDISISFTPVIIRFLGFMLSFFFIGIMWTRHLRIFKYLRTYNSGVIFRNLVFIFFIVCFPFSASGITENIRSGFILPIFIYIINIWLVSASQFILCYYLFAKKTSLCIAGFEVEKKYILLQSKYSVIMLLITIGVMLFLSFIFHGNFEEVVLGFYIMPILLIFVKKHLKKYKPIKSAD